jgi:hypothetical protein
MNQPDTDSADPNEANIALVNTLMAQLNVTRDQLDRAGMTPIRPIPTFTEYIPQVRAAVTAGTLRAYDTYWQRIITHWGDRRLNEPTPTEIKELAQLARQNAITRRNSRGGGSAAEHLIAALRCIYQHAINDRLLGTNDNPAARVRKPRRQPSLREALPERAIADIVKVTSEPATTPNSTCSSCACTWRPPAAKAAPCMPTARTSTPTSASSGSTKKVKPNAGNRSPRHSPAPSSPTSTPAATATPAARSCATATADPSANAATTTSGNGSAPTFAGPTPTRSAPTGYATPPSPGSNGTSGSRSPSATPATPTPAAKPPSACTPKPPKPKSPKRCLLSPASPIHWRRRNTRRRYWLPGSDRQFRP